MRVVSLEYLKLAALPTANIADGYHHSFYCRDRLLNARVSRILSSAHVRILSVILVPHRAGAHDMEPHESLVL